MPAGMLEVAGSIDVKQFWPDGRSDADTTKVLVNVGGGAIQFRKNAATPFQVTHVFENALVKGRTTKAPIKNGQLTIRLQGIDATELHYQPSALSKTEKNGLSKAKLDAYHAVNIPTGSCLARRPPRRCTTSSPQPERRRSIAGSSPRSTTPTRCLIPMAVWLETSRSACTARRSI